MPRILYKNTFGSQNSRLDQQRADLFKVTLVLPEALNLSWTENVEFAVSKWPFPNRDVEAIQTKYLQQSNWQIGGDVAVAETEINVRYAFAQRTAETLEKWYQLVSNMQTGGVGLTSEVKSKGFFRWLVPNMARQIADLQPGATPGQDTLQDGLIYVLEDVWPRGLKWVDADMTVGNTHADMLLKLQVDRYYPFDIANMAAAVGTALTGAF